MRCCPFNHCAELIEPTLFACRQHWFWLNRYERARIAIAWDQYQDGKIGIEELRRRQQEVLGTRGNARKGDSIEQAP